MSQEQLRQIRLFEVQQVRDWIPSGSRVLEIGAGAGWQAQYLAAQGCEVSAVDVADSQYLADAVYPVTLYDGRTLPFPDASFDVVFSSNVLEHVADVEALQQEIARVLKGDGRAIHLLPTATWRLWTNCSHYLRPLKLLLARPLAPAQPPTDGSRHKRSTWARLAGNLVPPRHGETGNALSELYYFSRFRWRPLFRQAGFRLRACYGSGLFYTGYLLLGTALGMSTRQRLSRVLGSSCLVYVLVKGSQ